MADCLVYERNEEKYRERHDEKIEDRLQKLPVTNGYFRSGYEVLMDVREFRQVHSAGEKSQERRNDIGNQRGDDFSESRTDNDSYREIDYVALYGKSLEVLKELEVFEKFHGEKIMLAMVWIGRKVSSERFVRKTLPF